MLGLGEEPDEIRQVMRDMLDRGVEIFTLGQYLRPSRRHVTAAALEPSASMAPEPSAPGVTAFHATKTAAALGSYAGECWDASPPQMPVVRMVPPAEYDEWQREGMAMGFKYVASGPLVRSSYKAGEVFLEGFLKARRLRRHDVTTTVTRCDLGSFLKVAPRGLRPG